MRTLRPLSRPFRLLNRLNSGVTLLELLVVFAVIGILVALLLPAVQQARESARRIVCRNHLRQIGLAMHNYHETHQVLPVQTSYGPPWGNRHHWGWIPRILPYLGEGNRANRFDFHRDGLDDTLRAVQGESVSNLRLIEQALPAVLCPSDPDAEVALLRADDAADLRLGLTSYAASVGDHANLTGDGDSSVNNYRFGNFATNAATVRGVISRGGWSARLRDIVDGSSNTILVGEVVPAWCAWVDWGHQNFSTTAHPINFRNGDFASHTLSAQDVDAAIGFRSRHEGGAFFLFVDGSVEFVSEKIDMPIYRARASRAGGEVASRF
jgi:prepilin-type N-terminal cleavage/methylation domain-containing protein/prepilin-type processing-associated H-X9-DG protein